MTEPSNRILVLTVQMVTAYLDANALATNEVPALIRDVHQSVTSLDHGPSGGGTRGPPIAGPPQQIARLAVDARKSVFADHVICLEDGKSLTTLKRHLRMVHNLTPEQYREKWGLPKNYPMVAPNYSKVRSRMAKMSGLGKSR